MHMRGVRYAKETSLLEGVSDTLDMHIFPSFLMHIRHLLDTASVLRCVAVCCSAVRCVSVCCSVLQCAAVRYRVLQSVAVCCSVLQRVAVCCSVLQCVAVGSKKDDTNVRPS